MPRVRVWVEVGGVKWTAPPACISHGTVHICASCAHSVCPCSFAGTQGCPCGLLRGRCAHRRGPELPKDGSVPTFGPRLDTVA